GASRLQDGGVSDPVFQLSRLSKTFRTPKGAVHAVRDVDIAVHAGEIVALLGPTGAGKSTTIDLLLGRLAPDSGTVRVPGMPPPEATRAGAVGVMLQTGSLVRDLRPGAGDDDGLALPRAPPR